MVIEEHARLEILLPNEQNWRHISEDDIIQNSLSIAEKCMDDGSFMLGGVFSAQLSAKLRISGENVNSYTVIGAKVNVYSWYGNDQSNEKLRGVFWITSATRANNIYTISASDALIWFDSISYADKQGESANKIYSILSSGIGSINNNLEVIINVVTEVAGKDKGIIYRTDSNIVNNMSDNLGYILLTPDLSGEISTKNPRDYVSWLAELACGFAFVNYSEGDIWVKIGQFWEDSDTEILPEETELNSCEIADFTLKFNRVYAELYDGNWESEYGELTADGITIDISANPFKDGHYHYNHRCLKNVIGNMYGKLTNPKIQFRPFKLKCHKRESFELGQKVKLPNGERSFLTSIKWQFRGGYTLSCAGRDTRILSVAAKRSQAAKIKDLAFTKINTEKFKMMKEISSSNSRIETLEASDVSDWNKIQEQIGDIWDAINGG